MAKKSSIEKNNRRMKLVKKFAARRERLKAVASDMSLDVVARFGANVKLAELPRNSSRVRIRNRCEVTGRPRAFYGKMRMSRVAVRDSGSRGMIPGLTKSSW